ncbi:MAG: DUF4234 domain-containing protein [Candidatus Nomurabacteria bacterium]|jgi:heme/copper-type cytochrome/quinol oxidase subunit 4|nr:DUF4234 domain-containing protein [Candidatus Nomurabacteria bacterium]
MKQRSPIAVFIFSFITCGLYSWYWLVKTKNELNEQGVEHIPTAWIWLIPVVGGIWWFWKYSVGVNQFTKGKLSAPVTFLLIWLLTLIGYAIVQDTFNRQLSEKA